MTPETVTVEMPPAKSSPSPSSKLGMGRAEGGGDTRPLAQRSGGEDGDRLGGVLVCKVVVVLVEADGGAACSSGVG